MEQKANWNVSLIWASKKKEREKMVRCSLSLQRIVANFELLTVSNEQTKERKKTLCFEQLQLGNLTPIYFWTVTINRCMSIQCLLQWIHLKRRKLWVLNHSSNLLAILVHLIFVVYIFFHFCLFVFLIG